MRTRNHLQTAAKLWANISWISEKFHNFLSERQSFWLKLCNPNALIGVRFLKIIAILKLMNMNFLIRFTEAKHHVLIKSRAPMAAAGRIHVLMEEPAMKSASPPAFDTTVLVWNSLLVNTARFNWERVAKATKQPGSTCLDCTKLSMTTMKPSKYSVILIQNLGLPGIWFSHSVCPTRT